LIDLKKIQFNFVFAFFYQFEPVLKVSMEILVFRMKMVQKSFGIPKFWIISGQTSYFMNWEVQEYFSKILFQKNILDYCSAKRKDIFFQIICHN